MNWIFASLPLLIFIVLTWIALGLLIVRRVFKLQDGFTVAVLSLPCGLVGYLFFVNALSYLMFVPITVWIVNIGVWAAVWFFRRRPLPALEWDMDVRTRRILAVAGVVTFVGILVFNAREIWGDTEGHATIIQLLANGQFPLRFQCNPDEVAAYQYGGNLIAAAAETTAAISPWDAQDVLVAYQVLCVCALIMLVIRRRTQSLWAGVLGIYLIFTVGHIVWLVLPVTTQGISLLTLMSGQTAELAYMMDKLMFSPWTYSVVAPGFITASFAHTHRTFSWSFGPLTILLFLALLDTPFPKRWTKTLALGYLLGTISLLQPSSLIVLAPGFAMLVLLSWTRRFKLDVNPWALIALSLLVAVVQGGVITDSVRSKLEGTANPTMSFQLTSPTLPSCSTVGNTFSCAILSVGNMGLVPFLLPAFALITLRGRKDEAQTVLLFGAIAGYFVPVLFSYGYFNWNLLRIINFTSWVLIVFMTPWLYQHLVAGGLRRWLAVLFIAVSTYSGVLTVWVLVDGRWAGDSLSLDFRPMVAPNDLAMMPLSRTLPLDAIIFDPQPCSFVTSARAGYLFGRYTRVSKSRSDWETYPDGFEDLMRLPTADAMRASGYTHLYVDQKWYFGLTQKGKEALRLGNYEVISVSGDADNFRILMRVCREDEACDPNPAAFPPSFTDSRGFRPDDGT